VVKGVVLGWSMHVVGVHPCCVSGGDVTQETIITIIIIYTEYYSLFDICHQNVATNNQKMSEKEYISIVDPR